MPQKIGVLLTNLGTPEAPRAEAVRRYLREFLGDRRVVEFKPRWLWWCILNGLILTTRPRCSAKAYQAIWVQNDVQAKQMQETYLQDSAISVSLPELHGSPLLSMSRLQVKSLQQYLGDGYVVALGMRYAKPSIVDGLMELRRAKVARVIVLPLYPQYSATTVATSFDAIASAFAHCRVVPPLDFIMGYHDHPAYIMALQCSVERHWREHGKPDQLLLSFHGLPQRCVDRGDPYQKQCYRTAELLAQALKLDQTQWQVSFQSRVGKQPWLPPYTDETLAVLGKTHPHVQVICPGFAADCLETIEEIDQENRKVFFQAGGRTFSYIPALNITTPHIKALATIVNAK